MATSSGTARMFVKPLRKTMKTLRAPHRRADVAQSNAVSPTPSTITLPYSSGRRALHAHIPASADHTRTLQVTDAEASERREPRRRCCRAPGIFSPGLCARCSPNFRSRCLHIYETCNFCNISVASLWGAGADRPG